MRFSWSISREFWYIIDECGNKFYTLIGIHYVDFEKRCHVFSVYCLFFEFSVAIPHVGPVENPEAEG